MRTGRPGKGLGHVDGLDATEHARARLKAILRTITGEQSLMDAAASVGLHVVRMAELRQRALQAAAEALEPGRPGRPRLVDADESRRNAELVRENERLRAELELLRIQLEVARAVPRTLERAGKKRGTSSRATSRHLEP